MHAMQCVSSIRCKSWAAGSYFEADLLTRCWGMYMCWLVGEKTPKLSDLQSVCCTRLFALTCCHLRPVHLAVEKLQLG